MTVVDPVIVAIIDKLTGLDVTPALTVHKYAPPNVIPPAAVVEVPTVRRTGVEEGESQFGSNDWRITIPVTLYFDLRVTLPAQEQAVTYLEAFIQAIDADQGLGVAGVIETKVTEASPAFVLDQNRTMFSYETTVECLRLDAYQ